MTKQSVNSPASSAANMPGGPVRFVIVTIGRTGSTRLRLLLDSHPSVTCHGELFGANLSTLAPEGSEAQRRLLTERAENPALFLERRVFDPRGSRAVGFKILHSQMTSQWPGLLQALQADRDVRIIHLVRRNGLKRFLSEYFVGTVTHRHQVWDGEVPPVLKPVELPVASLLEDLELRAAQSAEIRTAFAGHPFHEVAYEDTLDGNGPAMRAVLSFIGVPHVLLTAGIRKVLPDDPRQLVTNHGEIERALASTPYRDFLK